MERNNYLEVGKTTKCGSCYPGLFQDCKEISKNHPDFICPCVCHKKQIKQLNKMTSDELTKWEKWAKEKIKEYQKFIRDIVKEQKRRFDNCDKR